MTTVLHAQQQPAESGKAVSKSTATENVHILNAAFQMPQLDCYRRIWIYLPPDYASGKKRYPVVYMHDGQNLFLDSRAAFGVVWKIQNTLNDMILKGEIE